MILPCHRLHISITGNACVDIRAAFSQEAASVWFSFLIAELPRSEAPRGENLVIYAMRASAGSCSKADVKCLTY